MGRRRNPFRGLVDHMSEMNRMREYIESGNSGHEEQLRTHANAWVPTTDIFARGDDLIIRCELAGVRKNDLDITVANSELTIYGERYSELEDEPTYYTRERSYGQFRRSITLPGNVAEDDVKAAFEDGLLEVTIEGGANLPAPKSIRIA